jgi:hypothetical protein
MEGKASYMEADGKYLGVRKDGSTVIMFTKAELKIFIKENGLKEIK